MAENWLLQFRIGARMSARLYELPRHSYASDYGEPLAVQTTGFLLFLLLKLCVALTKWL